MCRVKTIVFPRANEVTFQTFDLPACGPKEVVCETIYSFVSPGSELRILAGTKESKNRFPAIPGYSWVGRVIEVGRDARGWSIGDLVSGRSAVMFPGYTSLWGGQASHHVCEVTGYECPLKLPEGADPWEYVAVEVAAIGWRAATCAVPGQGETAVVIGQGLVGAFALRWLALHGVRVIALDMVNSRLQRALRWGAAAVVDPRDGDTRERILAVAGGGVDIALECSSSRAGVELANTILRQPAARAMDVNYPVAALHGCLHYWPRLVYVATYTHTHEIEPGGLKGGTEGALVLTPCDRTVGDRACVIERIRLGQLPMADVAAAPTPVEEAPDAYFRLRDNPDKYNTMVFEWRKP
ncbi:MAG: medium chain dehydrogenase/reductase family protein [Kiritimatiellae bacterium]|nr:medium chain dehydrogenase/reductase family protein [Kiritimatiellia bacterium]